MKRKVFGFIIAMSLAAVGHASSWQNNFYVGLGYSYIQQLNPSRITNALTNMSLADCAPQYAPCFDSIASDQKNNNTVSGLAPTLGYRFNPYISLELNYKNTGIGTQQTNTTAKVPYADTTIDYHFNESAKISSNTLGVNILLDLPLLNNELSIFSKIGVSLVQQNISINSYGYKYYSYFDPSIVNLWNTTYNQNDNLTLPNVGLGMKYTLPFYKRISFSLSWDHIFADNDKFTISDPTTDTEPAQFLNSSSNQQTKIAKFRDIDSYTFNVIYQI